MTSNPNLPPTSGLYRPGDGGNAFPTCEEFGMSLRDYFAAHAPAEPLWAFQPVMKTKRPEPQWGDNRPGCQQDCGPINEDALNAYETEYEKEKAIQWRWTFADALLDARSQPAGTARESPVAAPELLAACIEAATVLTDLGSELAAHPHYMSYFGAKGHGLRVIKLLESVIVKTKAITPAPPATPSD